VKAYLDTSVVLAYYLNRNPALERLSGELTVGSSRLLWVEFSRVVERALRTRDIEEGQAVALRRAFAEMGQAIDRLRLNEAVLRRAEGSFPLVVRSLDALHLASAALWCEPEAYSEMEVWSLDRQMNLCAAAMGFITPLLEL
jgi:Predicted nucleic acid-binding protein, contains PIN domain